MTLRHSLAPLPSSSSMSLASISYIAQRSCPAFLPTRKAKTVYKPGRYHNTTVGSNRYKHIPHRLKPAHLVATRNARERKRVRAVNCAFVKLRTHVPHEARHRRLSKVKTLRYAIEYIRHLQKLIETHDQRNTHEGQLSHVTPNCSPGHHYHVTPNTSPCHHYNFILHQGARDAFSQANANTCLAAMPLTGESNSAQLSTNCPEMAPVLAGHTFDTLVAPGAKIVSSMPDLLHLTSPGNCPPRAIPREADSLSIVDRELQSGNVNTNNTDEHVFWQDRCLNYTLSVRQSHAVSRHGNTQAAGLDRIKHQTPSSSCLPVQVPCLFLENSVDDMACDVVHHKQVTSQTTCSNEQHRRSPASPHQTCRPPPGHVSSCSVKTPVQAPPSCTGCTAPFESFAMYPNRLRSGHDDDYIPKFPGHVNETGQDFRAVYSRA